MRPGDVQKIYKTVGKSAFYAWSKPEMSPSPPGPPRLPSFARLSLPPYARSRIRRRVGLPQGRSGGEGPGNADRVGVERIGDRRTESHDDYGLRPRCLWGAWSGPRSL